MRKARLPYLVVALTAAATLVVSLAYTPYSPLSAKAAHKSKLPGNPPTFVLMRGDTVIQTGRSGAPCWYYWKEYPDSVEEERANQPEGYWRGYCHALAYRKKTDLYPRDAVLVSPRVGTLHIRIGHARRPDRVQLIEGLKPNNRKLVLGWGRPLDYTLRRYRPDDKTVAWDVFFRLPPRPTGSHYYLNIWADWEHVPGRHVSSGDSGRFFHVKTR